MQTATYFWIAALIIFGIIEASCPCLLSIWFCVGSLSAIIASELGAALWLQIVLFGVVSGILLALLRPALRRYFTPRIQRTNVDSLMGERAIVTAPIDNLLAQGQVKVNGMEWTARASDAQPIEAGSVVRIDRVEGVKLFVTKQ